MKKNILAVLTVVIIYLNIPLFAQTSLAGNWKVQNISYSHSGKTVSEPYHVMFFYNWKNNIPVRFTKDSVIYQNDGIPAKAAYIIEENNITFRFNSGKAGKTGSDEPDQTVITTSTFGLETISAGYRLLLLTAEDITIIELLKN